MMHPGPAPAFLVIPRQRIWYRQSQYDATFAAWAPAIGGLGRGGQPGLPRLAILGTPATDLFGFPQTSTTDGAGRYSLTG